MTARISLFDFMPYGAPELLAASRRHMLRAQAASCALMLALFATAVLVVPRETHVPEIVLLPPVFHPKPIAPIVEPKVPKLPHTTIVPPAAHSGMVVPVDDEAKIDEVITPTAADVTGVGPATGEVAQPGDVSAVATAVIEDTLPVRGVPIHVDQPPVAIAQPLPVYPDIAREAGIEGKVRVYILIGKDGHVLRAEVDDKVHAPMLDAAALEAAKRWVFTPAYTHGRPVAVWDVLPFEFTLH